MNEQNLKPTEARNLKKSGGELLYDLIDISESDFDFLDEALAELDIGEFDFDFRLAIKEVLK